jgi:hypothetical protein
MVISEVFECVWCWVVVGHDIHSFGNTLINKITHTHTHTHTHPPHKGHLQVDWGKL